MVCSTGTGSFQGRNPTCTRVTLESTKKNRSGVPPAHPVLVLSFVCFSLRTKKRTSALILCGALPLCSSRKVQEHDMVEVLFGTKTKGYLLPTPCVLSSFDQYFISLSLPPHVSICGNNHSHKAHVPTSELNRHLSSLSPRFRKRCGTDSMFPGVRVSHSILDQSYGAQIGG